MIELYRVQDKEGRGPFKPGFSRHWIDADSDQHWQQDVISAFGLAWRDEIPRGWWCGCACRSLDGIGKWFLPKECARLKEFGYFLVRLDADKIIRENDEQVIFARRQPLTRGVSVLDWSFTPIQIPATALAGRSVADSGGAIGTATHGG